MKKIVYYFLTFFILSSLVIIIIDQLVMPYYIRHGKGRYMVNVVGKDFEYSNKVLKSEGYKSLISDTLYTSRYEPGTVVDQYPVANTLVKEGRTVRLKIAHSEKMVVIPDLVGRSIRSAELSLQQNGLQIDTVYKEYNSDVPEGNVTWQYPKGGDFLNRGRGVEITISLGVPPNFFQVPNVFGLSKKKAEKDLLKAGFKIGKIYYRQNEDLIPYTVLDQSIAAETVLEDPAPIDLTVSVLDMQDIFNQMIDK